MDVANLWEVDEGRVPPPSSTCALALPGVGLGSGTRAPSIGAVVLFGLALGLSSCMARPVPEEAPLRPGETFGIELTDLDGNPVEVRSCHSLYIIDPDCSVCIREALELEATYGEVWVSVGSAVRSREFVLLFGDEGPLITLIPSFVGLSVDEQLRLLGVVSTPRTVVLDGAGSVSDVRVGFARDLVAPSCPEGGANEEGRP